MKIEPVILEGEFVRLEPLEIGHTDALFDVGLVEEIWRWTPTRVKDAEDMKKYVAAALEMKTQGAAIPFVTIERSSGRIVGSTRFGNIDTQNRLAEIGWTWINPAWQRTSVNTEAKLLMLTHAFEIWKCVRVEFKTDALNEKSRKAIVRLGAKEEGILRRHIITETGRFRDTVYFSIIDSEWQNVKAALNAKLRGYK